VRCRRRGWIQALQPAGFGEYKCLQNLTPRPGRTVCSMRSVINVFHLKSVEKNQSHVHRNRSDRALAVQRTRWWYTFVVRRSVSTTRALLAAMTSPRVPSGWLRFRNPFSSISRSKSTAAVNDLLFAKRISHTRGAFLNRLSTSCALNSFTTRSPYAVRVNGGPIVTHFTLLFRYYFSQLTTSSVFKRPFSKRSNRSPLEERFRAAVFPSLKPNVVMSFELRKHGFDSCDI